MTAQYLRMKMLSIVWFIHSFAVNGWCWYRSRVMLNLAANQSRTILCTEPGTRNADAPFWIYSRLPYASKRVHCNENVQNWMISGWFYGRVEFRPLTGTLEFYSEVRRAQLHRLWLVHDSLQFLVLLPTYSYWKVFEFLYCHEHYSVLLRTNEKEIVFFFKLICEIFC